MRIESTIYILTEVRARKIYRVDITRVYALLFMQIVSWEVRTQNHISIFDFFFFP